MKKILLLCLAFSLFIAPIHAVRLILSTETGSLSHQVVVKLTTRDFTNVIGIQYSISFDAAVLQYTSVATSNLAALGFKIGTTDVASGQIGVLWINPALAGLSLPDDVEVMQLSFTVIGGAGTTSNLTIGNTPTPFKALDGSLAYTAINSVGGSVQISAILPTELTVFSAKLTNKNADLNWQTATEHNVSYFSIEHGNDGENFLPIGEVKANGNSRTPQYYRFSHADFSPNSPYYRLKMVDADAQFKYSKIITLYGGTKGVLSVQKRGNQLIINGLKASSEMEISIADVTGRTLFLSKKKSNTEGSLSEPMPYLLSGIYIFTAHSKQNVQSAKIFIEQ